MKLVPPHKNIQPDPISGLAEIEVASGKPRADWSLSEWKSAAEALDNALSLSLGMTDKALAAIKCIKNLPAKKRGRKSNLEKRGVGLWIAPAKKRPPARKWDIQTEFNLVVLVDAEKIKASNRRKKITDKDALFILFRRPGVRDSLTRKIIANKLAPALSRARRRLNERGAKYMNAIKSATERRAIP